MACPFSRGFTRTKLESDREGCDDEGSSGRKFSNDSIGKLPCKSERFRTCRQSSIQITSSLLGEEIDDQEDTQTLNLKHLRAAVLILTKPS
ncbi:hypothetical protein KQX54_008355, partial [Cotesia glomerata]